MTLDILFVCFIVIIILVFLMVIPLFRLQQLKNKLSKSKSEVEYAINRRWIFIPKYIEEVKPNVKVNVGNIERMILLRNTTFNNMDFVKKWNTDEEFKKIIEKVQKEYEYSSTLQEELLKIEKRISEVKNECLALVEEIDRITGYFPYNLVGFIIGIEKDRFNL